MASDVAATPKLSGGKISMGVVLLYLLILVAQANALQNGKGLPGAAKLQELMYS